MLVSLRLSVESYCMAPLSRGHGHYSRMAYRFSLFGGDSASNRAAVIAQDYFDLACFTAPHIQSRVQGVVVSEANGLHVKIIQFTLKLGQRQVVSAFIDTNVIVPSGRSAANPPLCWVGASSLGMSTP